MNKMIYIAPHLKEDNKVNKDIIRNATGRIIAKGLLVWNPLTIIHTIWATDPRYTYEFERRIVAASDEIYLISSDPEIDTIEKLMLKTEYIKFILGLAGEYDKPVNMLRLEESDFVPTPEKTLIY